MTQKPIHQTQDHRQLIWDELKSSEAAVTRADLRRKTAIAPSTIGNYLKALVAGKIVTREDHENGPAYRIAKDVGYHAPRIRSDGSPVRSGGSTQNIW